MLRGKKEQMASTGRDITKITGEYRRKDKEVKKNCKEDKQQWINQKASEAELAAEVGNTKLLYQTVKELAGSTPADHQSIGTVDNHGNTEIMETVIFVKCRVLTQCRVFAVIFAKMP